ncbi:MAG: aminodeoxychorismate synthase component I [Paracoccaceae bacterium]
MILCEFGPLPGVTLFDGAVEVLMARTADEVVPVLALADDARARGRWVAGYLAYEAGYAMEPVLHRLMPERTAPLVVLGIYDRPREGRETLAAADASRAGLAPLRPAITRGAYDAAFDRVKAYIATGDCYQINLTFPLDSRLTSGTPLNLYAGLRARQSVGFGAFVDLGIGPVLVSRSPELFLRLDAGGRIEARPMKGTAPRDPDPVTDAQLAADLQASEKGRAENLMIVDLLRNDIARIARVGSVRVPELFAIDSFATVHQMSSRITGQLAAPATLSTLMPALFPCGSITGAPKIRAMQIIAEVERYVRGAYCGAIGWMGPDGAAAFSVAIRTLSVYPDGAVTLNVGGGVVQDSTAEGEWTEALWKAAYATGLSRGFA